MEIPEIIKTLALIISGASAVAALTPTPKDDKFIAKIYKVIELLALNIFHAKK
tara:strand:+ start:45 stop:203 length:159 start_codon:yes stop_codon:yes gene_type:complete